MAEGRSSSGEWLSEVDCIGLVGGKGRNQGQIFSWSLGFQPMERPIPEFGRTSECVTGWPKAGPGPSPTSEPTLPPSARHLQGWTLRTACVHYAVSGRRLPCSSCYLQYLPYLRLGGPRSLTGLTICCAGFLRTCKAFLLWLPVTPL